MKKSLLISATYSFLFTLIVGISIQPFDVNLSLWSLLGLFAILIPGINFLMYRKISDIVILIPASMTWIYFLAPYLYSARIIHSYRIISEEYLFEMAMYSTISIIFMLIGYYIISDKVTPSNKLLSPTFKFNLNTLGKISIFFLLLAVLSRVIDYYFHSLTSFFGQLFVILDFVPILAIVSSFMYYIRGGKNKIVLSISMGYFILEILLRISETLFSKIIYIIIGIFFVYVLSTKKIPWKTMILAFILMFPLFNSRMDYRMEAHERWYGIGGAEKLGIFELIGKGSSIVLDVYSKSFTFEDMSQDVQKQASSRFENISYLGQAVYMVKNNNKELKLGETFWWVIITPIPRVIFPWKPVNNHATQLAEEYGTKGIGSKAAMNFPMLVEYFINFSFLGMVFFSLLQGMAYKYLFKKISFGQGDINLLIFINLFWYLVRVEANTTLIFGGILQTLIMWWLIMKVISQTSIRK